MSARITIETGQESYHPSQQGHAHITLHLDEPLKIRGITATFVGGERTQADYSTTSTDSEGKRTTEEHTAVEFYQYDEESYQLEGQPPKGFLATAQDSILTLFGGGKGFELKAGIHQYEVEFFIPEIAQPSIWGSKCRVYYELRVRVHRALAP